MSRCFPRIACILIEKGGINMTANLSQYLYKPGTDPELDEQFSRAAVYGRIRLGHSALFWKAFLRWYTVPLDRVRRAFRRVEEVHGKMCCGGHYFRIERLVLVLTDGHELELYIGDDVAEKAQALFQTLRDTHPRIQYGKP